MRSRGLVGTLGLVTVLLLVLGITYAQWTETLTIETTMETGELDVQWSVGTGYDSESEGYDYSSISGTLEDTDGDGDYDKIVVTISNAYPCIDYYLPISIENIGTIPAEVASIDIDRGNLTAGTTVEIIDGNLTVGIEFEPNEKLVGVLHVHLGYDAAEKVTYTFTITVTIKQWNV